MTKYLFGSIVVTILFFVSFNSEAATLAFLDFNSDFSDDAGNAWTAVGDTSISSAQSVSGGASAFFDGSGDYIQADDSSLFNFGSSPFSIDFYMYPLNAGGTGGNTYLAGRSHPDGGAGFDIRYDFGEVLVTGVNGWAFNIGTPGPSGSNYINQNAWNYVMLSSTTTDVYLYVDNVLRGQSTRGTISGSLGNPFRIGYTTHYGGSAFYGYIDDFRISDIALTPSSSAVPEPASLVLFGSGLLGLGIFKRRKKNSQ